MASTIISIKVPAAQADAARDGIATILATLGLPDSIHAAEMLDEADILAQAREILTSQDIDSTQVKTIAFYVDEWENGYFYSNEPRITFVDGYDGETGEDHDDWEKVSMALYNLREGASLGERDPDAVIDLTTSTITVD